MTAVRSLLDTLREIPDVRSRRGRRYPLPALLALACAATLCGAQSYAAIAEWGRKYDADLIRALGFTRATMPCAATLFLAFRGLDRRTVEAVLAAWSEEVLAATAAADAPAGRPLPAVALDGKTLRGSRKQGAPGTQLVSALSHRLGLTLGQVAVDAKTNEIGAAPELLRGLVLEGRVFTMDALLSQRAIAHTLVDAGAHYVMIAKENQPTLLADIAEEFRTPPPPTIPPGRRRRPRTMAMGAMRCAR